VSGVCSFVLTRLARSCCSKNHFSVWSPDTAVTAPPRGGGARWWSGHRTGGWRCRPPLAVPLHAQVWFSTSSRKKWGDAPQRGGGAPAVTEPQTPTLGYKTAVALPGPGGGTGHSCPWPPSLRLLWTVNFIVIHPLCKCVNTSSVPP
jgi:hypothetical protein